MKTKQAPEYDGIKADTWKRMFGREPRTIKTVQQDQTDFKRRKMSWCL